MSALTKSTGMISNTMHRISGQAFFDEFLYNMRVRSLYHIQDDASYEDQLLIFSTCDYAFYGDRFIVVARRLREGETEESVRAQYIMEEMTLACTPIFIMILTRRNAPQRSRSLQVMRLFILRNRRSK